MQIIITVEPEMAEEYLAQIVREFADGLGEGFVDHQQNWRILDDDAEPIEFEAAPMPAVPVVHHFKCNLLKHDPTKTPCWTGDGWKLGHS